MPKGSVTVNEAAERIGCHEQWVHKLIDRGDLKAEKIDPRVRNSPYLVNLASLNKYIAEHPKSGE